MTRPGGDSVTPSPTTACRVELHDADAPLPAGLVGLVRACTAADAHPPFGEHTLLTLDGHRQVRHARLVCWQGPRLVGYAVLAEGLDAWYLELAVHPCSRGQGSGTALVRAATAHVASHGGGAIRAWAHHAGTAVERLATGWRASRVLHVLERSLHAPPDAPAVPAGLQLRMLDTSDSADRDAWLALSNAAFAGHPENGGWTRDDLDWRMDAAWTASGRFPVLHDDSGLVAGVWTKADSPTSPTGAELYVVAVHPCRQGRGLGGIVVAEALRRLTLDGHQRAVLYVDADNSRAQRLYTQHGFAVHHQDRCYGLNVATAAAAAGPVTDAPPAHRAAP